jgi:hypothetical protein
MFYSIIWSLTQPVLFGPCRVCISYIHAIKRGVPSLGNLCAAQLEIDHGVDEVSLISTRDTTMPSDLSNSFAASNPNMEPDMSS